MAIGERIRYFRNLRGMTLKWLGVALGFPERTADIRMSQYETGTRTPKADLTNAMAEVLNVSPHALDVPDIDTDVGLMHTMFTLEDTRGLIIDELDGEVCLRLGKPDDVASISLLNMLTAWKQEARKLQTGEITKEEYDQWRHTYPQMQIEWDKAALDAMRPELKDQP
ncbi:MAG: helix-turn-helix transcriptional regulator [Raoultibacter sp.]